jgi:ornithine carbamoyltransferase
MMKKKDLISISELGANDIIEILLLARRIKKKFKSGRSFIPLKGKTLAMIFHKPSTRTRVSFEVGMFQLGGTALYLGEQDLQLKRGESVNDTALTLSRYVDGIVIRTYSHQFVVDFARAAKVPVINGLTDLCHPCQILADLFTIIEKKNANPTSFDFSKLQIAYIGDGNNICNSWISAAGCLGFNLIVACPSGYGPDSNVLNKVRERADKSGSNIEIVHSASDAVADAGVIYTDAWASMGKDDEIEERKKIFRSFQVNSELMKHVRNDAIIMHCLPAHRGDEITDEVIDGPHSVVFDQAENRLHVQKAILYMLLGA